MPRYTVWTPERVETLLRLKYVENRTTRQIMTEMNLSGRGAVIGKLNRLEHDGTADRFRERHSEPPPEPEPEPAPVVYTPPADKDSRLCVHPGCTRTKMAQNLHRLCQEHDQQRIAAKKKAA